MRKDIGDGKNVFGKYLNEAVSVTFKDKYPLDTSWGSLTGEQCQSIRELFSIMKDKSGFLEILDDLSNEFCGTKGCSFGSWDEKKQCYTGGIFSGAKTSENQEIWERYCLVTKEYFKKYLGVNDVITWSWAGNPSSPFYFEKDGQLFFDSDKALHRNYTTNIYNKALNTSRSWNDVLRQAGYKIAHDTVFPGKNDGQQKTLMRIQLLKNMSNSRIDCLDYSTNTTTHYLDFAQPYNEQFFKTDYNRFSLMYEDRKDFFKIIEGIRHDTANGIVHGEIIDSLNTYGERVFFEEVLKFCYKNKIRIITKREAYKKCFAKSVSEGNLLYNANLVNSVTEYMPSLCDKCTNPDGYIGNCSVTIERDLPVLVINEITEYNHFGLDIGKYCYAFSSKGEGKVTIHLLYNKTPLDNQCNHLATTINISSKEYEDFSQCFVIEENMLSNDIMEQVIGIKILFEGDMAIAKQSLTMIN